MRGLISYGSYIPHHRLARTAIAEVLGAGGGKGTRAVASFDEDSTSMGVEAARVALTGLPASAAAGRLYFATSSPAYLEKTNAVAIHAALSLGEEGLAVDMGGALRSGVGAVLAAADSSETTVAVIADIRTGLPGSADEREGGDGAAAFVFGDSGAAPVLAELVAHASSTAEFLDRWRVPEAATARSWEERFSEQILPPLADSAFTAALKRAEITADDVDHLIVSGSSARAAQAFARSSGVRAEARADDLTAAIGNAGTVHAGIVLADVLDRAGPGETIAVVVLADGATAMVLRTTDALHAGRRAPSVASQIASGDSNLSYATFLSWRGMLDREPPRRPDPAAPFAPPAFRAVDWKFGLVACRCEQCGTRSVPPARVCYSCGAVDRMAPDPLRSVAATVATFTIDRLVYTPSPPMVSAVIDFDGGGRLRCEMTDVDPSAVAIGDRVEMTFRRMLTANGIHNYFWKARPVPSSVDPTTESIETKED
jgi:3-hydroxy-3-methylglutaryl CoA synthase/uncharacterized OB-fold protein